MVTSRFQKWLHFWGRHLALLNGALLGLVWFLYGNLILRGFGGAYAERVSDLWLQRDPTLFNGTPGIENVLLPGLAAAFSRWWRALGLEFTTNTFIIFAAVPYALFIYAVTRHISRRSRGGRLLAVPAAIALYTSGMIPYMASWGGSLDGLSYLLMVPVIVWPESLLVYVAAFVLQCLNHYLGALALLVFAFVWHSVRALGAAGDGWNAKQYWVTAFMPRLVLSGMILAAFLWFWAAAYPQAAQVRQVLAAQNWRDPVHMFDEVLGPFPWTLVSTLKFTLIPVAAWMIAAAPGRRLRGLALAAPFLAAAALTFVFVDITRVATMLVLPVLLVTIHAAGGSFGVQPALRRRLRRLLIGSALLNLLIPNYYVHNGDVIVPDSQVVRIVMSALIGADQ